MGIFKNTFRIILLALMLALGISVAHGQVQLFSGRSQTFQNTFYHQSSVSAPDTLSSTISDTDITKVVDKATPAIVSIYGYETPPAESGSLNGNNTAWDLKNIISGFMRETTTAVRVNAGTGFFISSDGYILTNKHVVDSTNATYKVTLEDGREKSAEVIYRDPDNDLAVLKISGSDYPVMEIGDSSGIKVGDTVVGIGNAFGKFSNTSSAGQVSAMHKNILADGDEPTMLYNVLQTSAQLYPGDSGGPLLNAAGQVVGIDVAMATDRAHVSFSIPINDAKHIIEAVKNK